MTCGKSSCVDSGSVGSDDSNRTALAAIPMRIETSFY
jgi:hypothetical protein